MSTTDETGDVPDSFDPTQPDVPTLAVDPDPLPEGYEGQDTGLDDELLGDEGPGGRRR